VTRTEDPALVLRKYDYSETSQVLRIFTRGFGILSVLAKGTKKPKSSFGGAIDLFYLGSAGIIRRPRGGLDLLDSFRVDTAHPGLRASLRRFCAACHLSEILVGMARETEPHPGLFDALRAGLAALEAAPEDRVGPILIALELAALRELGFAPSLARCAACGAETGGAEARLSVRQGGVVCAACREAVPDSTPVRAATLSGLLALDRLGATRAERMRLPAADEEEMRGFLDAHEEWRLERPLRTARFLR
jgi:DNA repair protein RecO (recombination protein O)